MKKKPYPNRFSQIDSDTARADVEQSKYEDAMGVRITSLGSNQHASTIKGNTLAFNLPGGYIPLGSTSYNGVMYIISYNPADGYSEIGTYPAPNFTSPGYTDQYAPLAAFTLENPAKLVDENSCLPYSEVSLSPFKAKLDLDCKSPIQLIAREDYDGSVMLYWTDFKNPIRSINSGFVSSTGLSNQRFTSLPQINSGAINLLNESNFHPVVNLEQLVLGGTMKAGHYFFFVRYTDLNYSATSFLGQSAPIPVFNERNNHVYGAEPNEATNKKVVLRIDNVDNAALFIELGFIYYYSETEFVAAIIDNRYPTNGNSSVTITVNGSESLLVSDIDTLTTYKPSDALKAKTITQVDNILYMANTQGVPIDHQDLRDMCCATSLREDSSYVRPIAHGIPDIDPATVLYASDPKDVNEKVGYFGGETYVFSLVPVFKGGFVGRAFPMQGYDNYLNQQTNPNNQGIYRFSNSSTVPYYENTAGNSQYGNARIKGIRLEVSNARAIFNNSQWLQQNLIGFYVARGERNKNVLYQGLAVSTCNGGLETFSTNDSNINNVYNKYMPLIRRGSYGVAGLKQLTGQDLFKSYYLPKSGPTKEDKVGVYSLDYYLDKRQVPTQVSVQVIGKAGINELYENTGIGDQQPFISTYYGQPTTNALTHYRQEHLSPSLSITTAKATNVLGFATIPVNGFASKVTEGGAAGNDGWYYRKDDAGATKSFDYNLPMALPDYIGLDINTTNTINEHIVNVCLSNPADLDYKQQYDFKNTLFSPISGFIPIDQFIAADFTLYQGDCFVARDYFKVLHGYVDSIGSELVDDLARDYYDNDWYGKFYSGRFTPSDVLLRGWGHMLSLVTEHAYNPNYRHELGRNYFYPATGINNIGRAFAWLLDSPESNFYNKGYKRMLSPRRYLGIDTLEPISNNRFPTRIRPSVPHVFGAVKDGYREFRGGEKDFSYQFGEIYALATMRGNLFSIQETAVNLHPLQERAQTPTTAGDSIATAQQLGLTSYRRLLSGEYGSMHRDCIVTGENYIHGIDYKRKIWWRASEQGVEPISLTKKAQRWIESVMNVYSQRSNILGAMPDQYPCGVGILGVYDANYKEVLQTFQFEDQAHTLCFNDQIDAFQTRYPFTPRHYGTIMNDLYSFKDGGFWLHDSNAAHNSFYNITELWFIRFSNNGDAFMVKRYADMRIEINNVNLEYIKYETQHQLALQSPFSNPNEFWYQPSYKEHLYELPIRRADSVQQSNLSLYSPESVMAGTYIVIEIGYKQTAPLMLRETLTFGNSFYKS